MLACASHHWKCLHDLLLSIICMISLRWHYALHGRLLGLLMIGTPRLGAKIRAAMYEVSWIDLRWVWDKTAPSFSKMLRCLCIVQHTCNLQWSAWHLGTALGYNIMCTGTLRALPNACWMFPPG